MSVPNIVYVMEPGESYKLGLATWHAMMEEIGKFGGRLKGIGFEEAYDLGHDLTLIQEAMETR